MAQKDTVAKYVRLNGKYLREAEQLLKKGDLVQASEKLWGAAAEITKAVAQKRGKHLRTHADLWSYVEILDRENPDWRLRHAFVEASALHSNFYEDELPRWAVEAAAEAVKDFVANLRTLL